MRWPLHIKIALGLAGIVTVIMGLSVLLLTISGRTKLVEDYRHTAIHVSDVAEAVLENAMMSNNRIDIAAVLRAIGNRESIAGVIIFNKRGEIKHSVNPTEVGRILSMDDPTCMVCHSRALTDRPQTTILPTQDGERILRVARPILNQPRCQNCHQERALGMLVTDFSMAEADRQIIATRTQLFLWAVLTIVGVIAAAVGFVHLMVTRPLGHFLRVTQSVGEGNLNGRVNLATGDEIGELAVSFDRLVQRVAARTRELEALNGMAATVSQSLDLDEVMHRALERVCQVTETEQGTIHLLDNQTGKLVLAASYGLPAPAAEKLAHLTRNESFAGCVVQSGEPLVVENAVADPHTETRIQELKSLALVPLRARGRVAGTLSTGSVVPRQFAPEDVALLKAIGDQVGVAIENARLYEETQRLSQTDPLTDLYNRRALEKRLQDELRRAQRYHHPLSLIMADIDHFKHYNDTHGHPQGDVVLRQVAGLLRSNVRETDFVARYGGEEFLIILPETTKEGGLHAAEKIRLAVETKSFAHAETQPGGRLTLSLGVATYPEDLAEGQGLIHKADEALYAAKRAGRNRVFGE